jgi:hypothetical protein
MTKHYFLLKVYFWRRFFRLAEFMEISLSGFKSVDGKSDNDENSKNLEMKYKCHIF